MFIRRKKNQSGSTSVIVVDKSNGIGLSVDKVLGIAKTITTLKIKLPASGQTMSKTMLVTQRHRSIEKLFDTDFWKSYLVE